MKTKRKTFRTSKNKPSLSNKKEIPQRILVGRDFYLVAMLVLFFFALLFYPGDGSYFKLFAYNSSVSLNRDKAMPLKTIEVPYILNPSLKPTLTATGVYVVDLASATPLYELNHHTQLYPASTTKVITALAAIKTFNIDQILTVKRSITEGQVAGLVVGERLTFENLLYALLVHSGNDAAYAIADNFPGGYNAFIDQMNRTAAELSMKGSHFTNPAGLDEQDQYISAFDLSLAARRLLESKELSKIVSTKSITISDVEFTHFHPLTNVNKLLGEIPGLGGLKTGYTENAKENLVSFYTLKGKKYVIVILKSEDRFEDTKALIEWINSNIGYKAYTI